MKLLDQAYQCIAQVERTLYSAVMEALATYPNLTLMRDTGNRLCQIPIVCFVHKILDHSDIVRYCLNRGIILRASTFLATDSLLHDMGIVDKKQGMVRLSLSHYNTLHEVHELQRVFESMDGW
jgi:selenocysteine lyase/cysteine desulfurase